MIILHIIYQLTRVLMGRSSLGKFLFLFVFVFVYLQSCVKDDAAKLVPPSPPNQSFVEEFDTVPAAFDRGWRYVNVSEPKGTGIWVQAMFNNPNVTGLPTPIPFPAYSSHGTYIGFIVLILPAPRQQPASSAIGSFRCSVYAKWR
jgi:hypothetical protein